MAWKPGPVTFIGAQEEQDDTCRVERAEGQEMRSLALAVLGVVLKRGRLRKEVHSGV